MNILVDEYRRQFPEDKRSDEDVTMLLASQDDGTYAKYPDFVADVDRINRYKGVISELRTPKWWQEPGRGFDRGVDSLKESGYGLGALAADVVGADSARDYLLKKYKDTDAASAEENASAVPRVEDIKDVGTGIRFALGKAGELIPQIGEALAFSAVGAMAGSTAAPGVGTVAGGAAGVTEGFLARQSAKEILKAGIEKILSKSTLAAAEKQLVESQIKKVAAKEVIDGAVLPATKEILAEAIKAKASGMGSLGAELVNFYGIGSGTIYGDLGNREGVDKSDAKSAALIGGIGSALANAPLPAIVLSRFFPGVGHEVANSYIRRLAKDVAIELPIGATGEALDELVQIAAEKYADPKRRDTGLDDQDLSRLLNAAVVGAGAGAMTSTVSAIPGGGESKPSVFPEEVKNRYWKNVTDERKSQILGLHSRIKLGALSELDENTFRNLNHEEKNYLDALSDRTEQELNTETASVTKSKEVIQSGKIEEENKRREDERRVLKQDAQPEENPLVGSSSESSITPDQVKSLVALGYDQNDIDNMSVDDATSFISENLESPKLARRNKMRAAATSTKTASASEARLKQKSDEAVKGKNLESGQDWVQPKPLEAKERRELEHRAEENINSGDPQLKEEKNKRLDRIKRDHALTRRERDEASTTGEKYTSEIEMVGYENEIRRLAGEEEVENQRPITEQDRQKNKEYLARRISEIESKLKGSEEITEDDRQIWRIVKGNEEGLPDIKSNENPKTETTSEATPTKTQEAKPSVVFGEVGDLKSKKVKLKDPIHGEEIPFKSGEKADKYLRSQYETLKVLLKCVGGAA